MMEDDFLPKAKKPTLKPLEPLSLDELRDYITSLTAEIARAEAEIARKQSHAAAASQFFRKPDSGHES